MATISIKHYDRIMFFEFEWKGSLRCGSGPDDETPDIDVQKGWLETDTGVFIRDFTEKELFELTQYGTPADDLMYLYIGEHQDEYEPDDDWWDRS